MSYEPRATPWDKIKRNNNSPRRGKSNQPGATPWDKMKTMKKILFLLIIAIGFASCSPMVHKNITKQLTPRDNTANVVVFDVNEMVPDNAEIIGNLHVTDPGFSWGCDWEAVLEKAKSEVRAAGGNGLEITNHIYPNQYSCHQIFGNILNISNDIQHVELSEAAQQSFHDYVVLKEGDTTRCRITDENQNLLAFIYERQGVARNAVVPKDKIIAYHIDDPVALAEQQYQRDKKQFTARFGFEGGYAFRTARFASGMTSDYKDYLRKLMRGPVLGANVRFNVDNMYSIGIHYDRFMSKNAAYAYMYDDDGNYYEGTISDDHTINFIAASFGYFMYSKNSKHRFFAEYLIGYMNYVDNAVEFGEAYTVKGATLGMGAVIDYDYMLSEHVAIGAGVSYYFGALSKAYINGYEQNLGNNREGLQRVNLKAGVRFYL